jgi:hypothetical protein
MKKTFAFIISSCLGAILSVSCSFMPRAATLNDALPRETDVPGWVITGQYRTSSMKKIGQVSQLYSAYDPVEIAVSEYGRLSDKSRTIRVELIRFHSPLDSFGLYGRERGFEPAVNFADDDSYSTAGGIFFRRGRYYTKITGGNLGEQESGALEQFRAVMAQNLKLQPGDELLPDSLFLFSDNRSTRDVIYYKNGVDGIPGLQNVSVIRRTILGKKYDIVYMKTLTAFDAEQEFQKLLKMGKETFMMSRIGKLPAAVRIVSDSEYLFISYYKHWIFGVLDADTMNEGNRLVVYLYGEIKHRTNDRGKE